MTIRRLRTCLLLVLVPLWGACSSQLPPPGGGPGPGGAIRGDGLAPAYRSMGPRAPAFLGGDPRTRDCVQVDGLLYLERTHVPAFRRGEVFDGQRYAPWDAALAPTAGPLEGFRLRTGRLLVYTNATWQAARGIAAEAEAHVDRLFARWGEAADLRLPAEPLPVVVARTRADFSRLLPAGVPQGRYAAWYDARRGSVLVCLEPVSGAEIPWQADLRHELTHQIFDLSRVPGARGRGWPMPWFWLWEGVALHAERLGGGAGELAFHRRWQRFQHRRARGQALLVQQLAGTAPAGFQGQHYDQCAALMAWLLESDSSDRRARMEALVGQLQRGGTPTGGLAEQLGMRPRDLEAAFVRMASRR